MKRKREESKTQSDEERLKRAVIKSRSVIKKKFQDLHNHRLAVGDKISETYKPIIDPLKDLVKHNKIKEEEEKKKETIAPKSETKLNLFSPDLFKTASKTQTKGFVYHDDLATSSANLLKDLNVSGIAPHDDDGSGEEDLEDRIYNRASSNAPQNDKTYGFRVRSGELYLGNQPVTTKTVGSNLFYTIRRRQFKSTPGLEDLLLLKNPKNYSGNDLQAYKEMLERSGAHKPTTDGSIKKYPGSPKYKNIISKLFGEKDQKKGSGLQTKFKLSDKVGKTNYTYWDDPNELVDRLRVLTASKLAGHTGHDNEIISIIEELREADVIK